MIRGKDKGLCQLVAACDKENHRRNLILAFAISLTMLVLFSAFSMAGGRVVLDAVKLIRESGSAASAYLENAEEEQYERLKTLDYIKFVGREYTVGSCYEGDKLRAWCKVVDETAYNEIIKPAYDKIKGHYPSDENEIMMSRRLLRELGVSAPQLGMKISVPILFNNWSVNNGTELSEEFYLSGYYSDYIDESQYVPVMYLSETYLASRKIPRYPMRVSIMFRSRFLSGMQMERRLYQDVRLANEQQQFYGNGTAEFMSVTQVMGGYGVAVLCIIIVLLSVYLLIYNVLSICLAKDIHFYGLLLVVGMTRKQLRKIIAMQNRIILMKGVLLGSVLCLLAGSCVFPVLFKGLFLRGNGEIHIGMVLYPEILAGAILLSVSSMLFANAHVFRKIKNITPIEAYKYRAKVISKSRRKHTDSQKGASILKMAWYNLRCCKRKSVITVLSLFIGCEVVLLSAFISKGTDIVNKFSRQPDFKIGTEEEAVKAYLFPYSSVKQLQVDRKRSLLDEELINEIVRLGEVDKDSVKQIYGCYAAFDYSEEFIRPKVNASYGTGTSNTVMTIRVVDDQYIRELEDYVRRYRLNVDIAALKNGKGILVLHKHELSESLERDACQMQGKPAHIYPVEAMDMSEEKGVEFVCSGYLDTTKKNFPQLSMIRDGDGVNYILVSERGYERLNYPRQVFGFTFNAREGQEAAAKERLIRLIQDENSKQESFDVYDLTCTSDQIREAMSYRNSSKAVMFTLCFSLSLLGITNYINVITTNIEARKNEFMIMEKIGMTRKQLKKMLIIEGLLYWGILMTALLSAGSLMLLWIGYMIKNNLSYFRFVYPIGELVAMAVILLGTCLFVPLIFLKVENKIAAA